MEEQLEYSKKRDLELAANALLAGYQEDPDLTAFTALDAEEFHASGLFLAHRSEPDEKD